MRLIQALVLFLGTSALVVGGEETMMLKQSEFNRSSLIRPYVDESNSGFSLLSPDRFSMQQSYSMNFTGGSLGSASSGLYLNHLSYKLSNPLVLSVDLGVHAPFHSSGQYAHLNPTSLGDGVQANFVLPRVGLEYRPTENSMISLEYINVEDAMRAYGPFYFHRPWGR